MQLITIPAVQASALLRTAQVLSTSLASLRPIDTDQPELALGIDQALDETMAERDIHLQAIEAFMDEREDLKADIQGLAATALEACELAQQLNTENLAMDAACMKAAGFVQSLRDQLGRIGIAFQIAPSGEAAISIDLPALSNSVEAIVESYAG